MKAIIPHLWFDKEAVEAAEFYTSVFEQSRIQSIAQIHDTPSGTADVVAITLKGQEFRFISAGPDFQMTPAISLRVYCSSKEEVLYLWEILKVDGSILMEVGEYPFSGQYGWLNDRYGVSWQLLWTEEETTAGKIVPQLLFSGQQVGKAKEAIEFYTLLFENSQVDKVVYYEEESDPNSPDMLQYALFTLNGQLFSAMDSNIDYGFVFNEAFSFLVQCDTREEIDFLWKKLSAVPEAEECGWLKDHYGVSWQITPVVLDDLLATDDEKRKERVTKAFLKMKKLDIAALRAAYEKD